MVEKQFLELVEDQIEIPAGIRSRVFERIRKRAAVCFGSFDQRFNRVSRPGREDDDLYALLLPKTVRDSGAQD